MSNDDEVFNVNNYSDSELLEFLDLNARATDRELEAKILQMMHQFPDNKPFLKDVYRRFFDVHSDSEKEEEEPGNDGNDDDGEGDTTEGFEASISATKNTFLEDKSSKAGKLTLEQMKKEVANAVTALKKATPKEGDLTPEELYPTGKTQSQSAILTVNTNYTKDKSGLNAVFNNTIQRVLILDSRCRDRTVYPSSTDFTINLTSTLTNVLGLNFYYVNVPYTWYTISKAYGANFFYLTGNAPGISTVNHHIKFEVDSGINLTRTTDLIDAVSKAIQKVAANRTDITFVNPSTTVTLPSVTNGNGLATFTWNFQNRFPDSSYEMYFPYWTSAGDYASNIQMSVPGFLGFLNQTYNLCSLYSNFLNSYLAQNQLSGLELDYEYFSVNETNNYFDIYNHYPDKTLKVDDASTYYNKIHIVIPTGTFSRRDLMTNINEAIANTKELNPQYSGVFHEKTSFAYSAYQAESGIDSVWRMRLSIQLNRFFTQNNPNQIQTVVFPTESGTVNTIWTSVNDSISAFFFDATITFPNTTFAEVGTSNSDVYTYTYYYSPANYLYYAVHPTTIKFQCVRAGDTESNTNTFDVQNSFDVTIDAMDGIPLNTYLFNINQAIYTALKTKNFTVASLDGVDLPSNLTVPPSFFYYDYDGVKPAGKGKGTVNAYFAFHRTFDYTHYTVDLTNSILFKEFGFPQILSFDQTPLPTNVYTSKVKLSTLKWQKIDNTNNLIVVAPKSSDPQISAEPYVNVYLPYAPQYSSPNQTSPTDGNWYVFTTLDDTIRAINGTFFKIQGQNYIYQYSQDGTVSSPATDQSPISLYGLGMNQTTLSVGPVDTDGNVTFTLTIKIANKLSEFDYKIELIDVYRSWGNNLGFRNDKIFTLSDPQWASTGLSKIYASHDVNTAYIQIIGETLGANIKNNEIWIRPRANADSLSQTADVVKISIPPQVLYGRFELTRAFNAAFDKNPVTKGTKMVWIGDDRENVAIQWNINKIYGPEDYSLTFFDIYDFGSCQNSTTGNSSLTNIRWDQTLGWMLGFRSYTAYNLNNSVATSTNIDVGYSTKNAYSSTGSVVSITGDTPVNIYLYNQLHIVLDDFTNNHMDDGIITIAPPSTNTKMQSYANVVAKKCDIAGKQRIPGFINTNPSSSDATSTTSPPLSANEVYAALAEGQSIVDLQSATTKNYSPPPNVKDMFALVPLKLSGLQVGQSYVEFGGTLQQNNRKFFGPVNISRIGLKLMSDRGDIVDLNNNDWSVGIICDISTRPF